MKYVVTLNGKQFEVEVEKVGGARKSLTREPAGRRERTTAPAAAAPAPVQAAPAPVAAAPVQAAAPSVAGGTTVASPMPGVILDVKVNVGDTVSAGQCLAILEAMKMENDIPAPVDGKVADIKVKKGDTVDTDAVLIVLE
ncbi:MAG: biotin/lipoyl-binding protein [Fusobacterium sp.]|nr:biotin/lipoyl-binding protein [Fusobacterium sp.]